METLLWHREQKGREHEMGSPICTLKGYYDNGAHELYPLASCSVYECVSLNAYKCRHAVMGRPICTLKGYCDTVAHELYALASWSVYECVSLNTYKCRHAQHTYIRKRVGKKNLVT